MTGTSQQNRLFFGIICLLCFLVGGWAEVPTASGADLRVDLRLDRETATLADSVRLEVVISGTRERNEEPRILGLETFRVSKGGTSSRLQIINGQVEASVEYTYFLKPKQTGEFTVGPAEITVKGKTARSGAATLTVEDVPEKQGDRGRLFLTAELTPQTVYVDQQVVYTLRLYRRIKVSDLSLSLPETKDLVFKKLGDPSEYETVYQGQTYQVVEVRYRLSPSQPGVYRMEPARMGMTVYEPRDRRRRGFFDDPFFSSFSSGKPATVTGNALVLQVLKLPEDDRPAGFSGLVGDFKISAGLTPSQVRQGESATFTVVVTGEGNINRIPDLSVPEIAGVKVYADQPVLDTDVGDRGLTGSKTMKWALVPEREGTFEIPSLSLSYFDPNRETYAVLKTLPLSLSVSAGSDETEDPVLGVDKDDQDAGPDKEEIKTLGRDILPIHTSVEALGDREPWGSLPLTLWLVLIVPPIVYAAVFTASKVRSPSDTTVRISKSKRAARAFERTCGGRSGCSAETCYEAFRVYLNDRFGLSLGSVTPEEAREILTSKSVRTDRVAAAEALLQKLEDAVYGGNRVVWEPQAGLQACHLVREIERDLK